MSRSGYSDDYDCDQESQWAHIRWRGQVASAIRGRRGQALLRDTLEALDAMPVKELVAKKLQCAGGVCTLGAAGKARGLDLAALDPEDYNAVADAFDISAPLAREIVYLNDEAAYFKETPSQRWSRMRDWVASQITPEAPHDR